MQPILPYIWCSVAEKGSRTSRSSMTSSDVFTSLREPSYLSQWNCSLGPFSSTWCMQTVQAGSIWHQLEAVVPWSLYCLWLWSASPAKLRAKSLRLRQDPATYSSTNMKVLHPRPLLHATLVKSISVCLEVGETIVQILLREHYREDLFCTCSFLLLSDMNLVMVKNIASSCYWVPWVVICGS